MPPWDEDAVTWSLLGALVAVLEREAARSGEMPLAHLAVALYAVAQLIDSDSLVTWNDHPARTQTSVLAVLDRAEATCEHAWQELSISSR